MKTFGLEREILDYTNLMENRLPIFRNDKNARTQFNIMGIDKNGNWQNIRKDGKFLFDVKALSRVFRGKFCDKLLKLAPEYYSPIRSKLWSKKWVVYAKQPFGSSKSVIEYLGRYTHKIAFSNHRIKAIDENTVTFTYKDYKSGAVKKQMTLTHEEFIRVLSCTFYLSIL